MLKWICVGWFRTTRSLYCRLRRGTPWSNCINQTCNHNVHGPSNLFPLRFQTHPRGLREKDTLGGSSRDRDSPHHRDNPKFSLRPRERNNCARLVRQAAFRVSKILDHCNPTNPQIIVVRNISNNINTTDRHTLKHLVRWQANPSNGG